MKSIFFLPAFLFFFPASIRASESGVSGESFFSFLSKQPPPGYVYMGIAVAGISLLWQVGAFLISRRDTNRRHQSDIHKEYWFEKIVYPICIQPLIEFTLEHARLLNELWITNKNLKAEDKVDIYNNYRDQFKTSITEITSKFLLVKGLDDDLYDCCISELENIDDIVTQHCYLNTTDAPSSVNNDYAQAVIVSQKMHFNLNKILNGMFNKYSCD